MAIEDAFELANDLTAAVEKAAGRGGIPARSDVEAALKQYQNQRMMRVSAIHGMAGMAAFMASTYKVGQWQGVLCPRGYQFQELDGRGTGFIHNGLPAGVRYSL
jgi:2-polyprenyl-6-methoxyphenol hydroxylase-like FAD-dependent oxidoreductase